MPNQLPITLIVTVENSGQAKKSLEWSIHYEKVTGGTLEENQHL